MYFCLQLSGVPVKLSRLWALRKESTIKRSVDDSMISAEKVPG